MSMPELRTIVIDEHLDVRRWLEQMTIWQQEVERDDAKFDEQLRQLDPSRPADRRRGEQIWRRRSLLRWRFIREPLEILPDVLERVDYTAIRQHLVSQFLQFSKAERHRWLDDLLFIVTPDVRRLLDKIAASFSDDNPPTQHHWSLVAQSGMGKTATVEWYLANVTSGVDDAPPALAVVKIDAPAITSSFKELLQRIALACDVPYAQRDTTDRLCDRIAHRFQQPDHPLLIIDEAQHLDLSDDQREWLETVSAQEPIWVGLAASSPNDTEASDPQITEDWIDRVELTPYTGERLRQLLVFLELIIPLSGDSPLMGATGSPDQQCGYSVDGQVQLIEQLTGGIPHSIISLIAAASHHAIEQDLPYLSTELLLATWREMHGE